MELRDLLPAAMVIVVSGVAISIGAEITTDLAGQTTNNATAVNATLGLEELGSWFDTLGLVIAAAVVLGVLMTAFYFGRR